MSPETSLFIMETFWDRQRYETASLCLTLTSVYFTAMANGNSKMYHSERLFALIARAGLEVVAVHDGLGRGHTLLEVRRPPVNRRASRRYDLYIHLISFI